MMSMIVELIMIVEWRVCMFKNPTNQTITTNLVKILFESSITLWDFKFKIDNNTLPTKEHRTIIKEIKLLENIINIILPYIKHLIETRLKVKGTLIIYSDVLEYTTYSRELTINELKIISELLGIEYYAKYYDIGEYISIFTNNQEEV